MVSARKPDTLTGAMRVRNFLKNGVFCRALFRASAKINHPVLLVFSAIFFVTERVS
jgi:hypothetical protein